MDAFEDLKIWKKSTKLAVNIYSALNNCKDYGLKDQVTRSAVSISSNIAEGFERNTRNQFIYHLRVAKGSCGELRSQLYICQEISVIEKEKASAFLESAREISRMIQGLIKHYL